MAIGVPVRAGMSYSSTVARPRPPPPEVPEQGVLRRLAVVRGDDEQPVRAARSAWRASSRLWAVSSVPSPPTTRPGHRPPRPPCGAAGPSPRSGNGGLTGGAAHDQAVVTHVVDEEGRQACRPVVVDGAVRGHRRDHRGHHPAERCRGRRGPASAGVETSCTDRTRRARTRVVNLPPLRPESCESARMTLSDGERRFRAGRLSHPRRVMRPGRGGQGLSTSGTGRDSDMGSHHGICNHQIGQRGGRPPPGRPRLGAASETEDDHDERIFG